MQGVPQKVHRLSQEACMGSEIFNRDKEDRCRNGRKKSCFSPKKVKGQAKEDEIQTQIDAHDGKVEEGHPFGLIHPIENAQEEKYAGDPREEKSFCPADIPYGQQKRNEGEPGQEVQIIGRKRKYQQRRRENGE